MFKRSGTGNFAYTSSRVKAKKSKLLKAEDYNKLQAMSVPEISRYISESGYSKEMTDMAGVHEGLELVEYATYGNMAKAFRSILGAASGDCKNMVGAYLKKWDYNNALTILRGKRYGLPLDEIRMDLVVAGYLNMEDFEKLMQMANVEEVLTAVCALLHIRIPDEVLNVYKAQSDLAPVEDFLVISYYEGLLASVKGNDRPTTVFRNYIRSVIDVKNIETLLKFKIEKVDPEVAMRFFIHGGREIDEKLMSQYLNTEDVQALLNDLQQLKMYADIKDYVSADTDVIGAIGALSRYQSDLAESVSAIYPLSVLPVVDYMLRKEAEVKNIRMIAYGTNAGLDPAIIKEMLVI